MPALHLIFSSAGLKSCLLRSNPNDVLLLLQDGVHAKAPEGASVLREHAVARGIESQFLASQFVDWDDMVRLTASCSPVVSWP
ncbi:MAG: hypothetical protein FJ194_06345 [Gammaproteobacteria bacterium]|nr:hypothetical protein [Gammaproteobacteria bacterium]